MLLVHVQVQEWSQIDHFAFNEKYLGKFNMYGMEYEIGDVGYICGK